LRSRNACIASRFFNCLTGDIKNFNILLNLLVFLSAEVHACRQAGLPETLRISATDETPSTKQLGHSCQVAGYPREQPLFLG
jgi:hypothetical protein